MVKTFQDGRDIYATLASVAFKLPYEECLEFNPVTHEYQPDGKARRGMGKIFVLGINYGMTVEAIADDLYGTRDDMTPEEKIKEAQKVYDSLMAGLPELRDAILNAQEKAKQVGYTETILGRRRHHPNMQLPEFEFTPMKGYMNPDIDPLDPSTLNNKEQIPQRIINQLTKEFKNYKYYGQIVKRTKALAEEHIKVINNRQKIAEASRQVWNCVDKSTEILTTSGWKKYDEVNIGDEILSYSVDRERVEYDTITAIHNYSEPTPVINFETPTFSSCSTEDHRWVVCESDEHPKFKTTQNIYKNTWPDYPILRVGDNDFEDAELSDDLIKLIGWILTDASVNLDSIILYQSTNRQKNKEVYEDMIATIARLGLSYTDKVYDHNSHSIYLRRCALVHDLSINFEHGVASFKFCSKLSQRQSLILMKSMLQGDGEGVFGNGEFKPSSNICLTCSSKEKADVFQYIAFRAGYATNSYVTTPEEYNSTASANTVYSSVGNTEPIKITKPYYKVAVLRAQRAQVYPHHKSTSTAEDGVWCVTTNNSTWIARRNGKVYITGNSVIQGSAADLTKMAMMKLTNDPDWIRIGGRFLIPVHDELIVEVPYEFAKEGAEILSRCMCDAGSFLPFELKCDVEETYRWYGLSVESIESFDRPTTLNKDELSESNIKWIQAMLFENEYLLPIYKNPDGSKPIGDAAHGVNGVWSDEVESFIQDYKKRYRISDDLTFIDHIWTKVTIGVVNS